MTKQTKSPQGDVPPREVQTYSTPPTWGTPEMWLRVQREVEAMPADQVEPTRIDLLAAGELVLEVCDGLRDDEALHARFAAVAEAAGLERELVTRAVRLGGAAWYARRMQLRAETTQTRSTVPEALVQQATELYQRMHRVARYHLGDIAAERAMLDAMNAAPGHRKLALQLHELAEMYARHEAVVSADARFYRASDPREARRVAGAIVSAMRDSGDDELALWTDRCARLSTLLARAYFEVQQVGRFLLRHTPDEAAARFPSLVAATRTATPRKAVVLSPTPSPDAPSPAPSPAPDAPRRAAKSRRRTR